jgi:hypothetical protein
MESEKRTRDEESGAGEKRKTGSCSATDGGAGTERKIVRARDFWPNHPTAEAHLRLREAGTV